MKSGPACEASPTRTAVLGATLRDHLRRGHLVLILPTRLAATARRRARRCLDGVAGRRTRATTHAYHQIVSEATETVETILVLPCLMGRHLATELSDTGRNRLH